MWPGRKPYLAHQDFQTGVRVGRFGVDVPAFERVALPALRRAQEIGGAVIIDEVGRMELAVTEVNRDGLPARLFRQLMSREARAD
ncbi:MAG: nucleoside-triphosphatase [Pseudonocardiaceae bacterium]